MLVLGLCTFKCIARRLALVTGVKVLNGVYEKVYRQVENDMETDCSLDNSNIDNNNS